MKIRLSLIFVILSVFFLSCSNGISQKGEGSVTVDLSEFIQKVSSRAADNGQTATVTLRTEGDFVTSVTETVSTSGGSITLDNLPIGKTITISLETTIAHKYFEGFSEPLKIKDGNNQVTIRLARNGISTDYLLYNYYKISYDELGYKYYLAGIPNQPITDAVATSSGNDNSFCFDGDGYYYILVGRQESATYIKSNRPGFGSNTLDNPFFPGAMYLYLDCGCLLTVDRLTNVLYMFDPDNSEINQVTKDDGTYTYDGSVYRCAKYFRLNGLSNMLSHVNPFSVYNGVVYIPTTSNGGTLLIADLKDASVGVSEGYYDVSDFQSVSLGLENLGMNLDVKFTDILYQNGALYILLRDYNIDGAIDSGIGKNNPLYSRGAVICYNITSGKIKKLGWTNDSLNNAEKYIYAFYSSNDGFLHLLTERQTSQDDKSKWLKISCSDENMDRYIPQIYTPATYNSGLYGPQKFIAIKPKKLVISDEGMCFYTDSNGAFYYKNVNRVVNIDLESFALSFEDTSASFYSDHNENPMTGSGFYRSKDYDGVLVSLYPDNNFTSNAGPSDSTYLTSGGDRFTFGFPLGE